MATVLTPSNVLPHSQRLRFIRSIRKLGDLLTESSMLVEPSTSPTLPSPSSSLDFSFAESKTLVPGSTQMHTFFTLRLPASPLTSTFAISPKSPKTPDIPVLEASVVTAPRAHLSRTAHRKRSSTVSVLETTPSSATLGKGAGRRAARVVRHTASSTSLRAPHSVPSQERHDEPFSYSTLVPIPSRSSISSRGTDDIPDAEMHSARRVRTTSTVMHRKEAGWSGEWSGSVRDMDDVVRGLRNLRLK